MKKIFGLIVSLALFCNLSAQILNQDAEGKSSIVWSGGSIGIDIKEGLIKSNYYSPTDKTKGLLFGVDLQAKNSSGVGALFNQGAFSPNAEVSGLLGYHFSKINYKTLVLKRDSIVYLIESIEKAQNNLQDTVDVVWETAFRKYADLIKNAGNTTIADTLLSLMNKSDYSGASKKIYKLANKKINNGSNKEEIEELLKGLSRELAKNNLISTYNKLDVNLKNNRGKLKKLEESEAINSSKHKLYVRPGLNASEFTYDNGIDTLNFNSRFVDTIDVNGFIELGYTGRYGNFICGAAVGYSSISTFSSLTDKKYKYSVIDTTIKSGTLQSSKEITAYSGNYEFLNRFYLNADLIYLISLNKKNKDYIGLGTYFRTNINSDTETLKNNTVWGLNLNFINGKKGKFLGSFYIQTRDLFGQDDKSFNKSLSYGFTAKFALKSITL